MNTFSGDLFLSSMQFFQEICAARPICTKQLFLFTFIGGLDLDWNA